MSDGVAVLLMSHGDFAREAMKSAELIIGRQENYEVLGVHIEDQVDQLRENMFAKVAALDISQGLIVFADITGGTPMNLAGNLLDKEQILVCTGLNLPILIECLLNRQKSVEEIGALIKAAYYDGMSIITSDDAKREDVQDDLFL